MYHFHEYVDTKKQEIEIEFETSLQRKYFRNTNFNLKQTFWHVIVGQYSYIHGARMNLTIFAYS